MLFYIVLETVHFFLPAFSFGMRTHYGFSQCSIKVFHISIGERPVGCYYLKFDVVLLEQVSKCHWFELSSIVSGDSFRISEGGEHYKKTFDDGICCGGF